MSAPIGWTARFKIRPGNAEAFGKVAEGAIAAVRQAEPRIVVYAWCFAEDRSSCDVHLWFADEPAALAHITGVAPREHLPRALELAELAGFEVYGSPGPALAKALASFPVSARHPEAPGFTRPPR